MSPNESTFLSGLRLELPYLVEALAGGNGFFHQMEQFHFLRDILIDHLRHNQAPPETFLVAGCDQGQDAYSLCIILMEAARAHHFPFSILATDFLPENVSLAMRGVYPASCLDTIPEPWAKRYFLRSRDPQQARIRLRPGVRKSVHFRCQDIFERFALRERMDVIFCRHILHHFDPKMACALAQRLHQHLQPGGLLFLGRKIRRLPGFRSIGPAVYLRV